MTRFCPNCGTEVDDSALFCPSCGVPIEPAGDPVEDAPTAASASPAPDPAETPAAAAGPAAVPAVPDPSVARTESHPRRAARGDGTRAANPRPSAASASPPRSIDVPVTWPVTLSGWLIGVGVALAALGVLVGFVDRAFNPIDVLLLPALVAVAVTVFFAKSVPALPQLAVATLAVALVAFGVGLDRIGFGGGLAELLLFLGAGAAAIGAIILAVGHDQPLGRRG